MSLIYVSYYNYDSYDIYIKYNEILCSLIKKEILPIAGGNVDKLG